MQSTNYPYWGFYKYALKYLRIKKGFTQVEVANAVGISPSTVSCHEKGNADPRLDTIVKYCKCYGLELAEFYHLVAISHDPTTPKKLELDATREAVYFSLM